MHKKNKIFYIYALILFIFNARFVGEPVSYGLDPSCHSALNYFFAEGLRFGKDVLFTYGPLGFLTFPQPFGSNFIVGNIFYLVSLSAFSLLYSFLTYAGAYSLRKTEKIIYLIISFVLGCITINLDLLYILFGIQALLVCIAEIRNKKSLLILQGCFGGVIFLIKPSFAILSFALLFSYTALKYVCKNISFVIVVVCASLGSLLIAWILSAGDVSTLADYCIATIEFSIGNSSAMTTNPELFWTPIIIMLIFFLLTTILNRGSINRIALSFLVPVIIWFKYSFSRIGHIKNFADLFFVIFTLLFICACNAKKKTYFFILIGVACLCVTLTINVSLKHNIAIIFLENYSLNQLKQTFSLSKKKNNNIAWIVRLSNIEKKYQNQSEQNVSEFTLSKTILSEISTSPVDIYPWEASYVFANKLNWRPRPVFQSYLTYTPWLDAKNAAFFAGASAPEYIIWDTAADRGYINSIDHRYILNDEPLTCLQIIKNYKKHLLTDRILILKKTDMPQYHDPITEEILQVSWDT